MYHLRKYLRLCSKLKYLRSSFKLKYLRSSSNLNYLRLSSKLKYLRSSSFFFNIWGCFPFTKMFKVVFHLRKEFEVVFHLQNIWGRLPFRTILEVVLKCLSAEMLKYWNVIGLDLKSDGQGHYVCDVKCSQSKTWFRTNDNMVPIPINLHSVTKKAVVILYKRK